MYDVLPYHVKSWMDLTFMQRIETKHAFRQREDDRRGETTTQIVVPLMNTLKTYNNRGVYASCSIYVTTLV